MIIQKFKNFVQSTAVKRNALALAFLALYIALITFIFPVINNLINACLAGWIIGGWCKDLADYLIEE